MNIHLPSPPVLFGFSRGRLNHMMESFSDESDSAHLAMTEKSETSRREAFSTGSVFDYMDMTPKGKTESQAEAVSYPAYPTTEVEVEFDPPKHTATLPDEENFGLHIDESEDDKSENNDSEDGDEELEDRIKAVISHFNEPYNLNFEALPNLAAYHPSFRKAEQMCRDLVDGAIDMLKSSSYQDTQTEELLVYLSSHREIEYPNATTVGMMGDSGVGKTLLVW